MKPKRIRRQRTRGWRMPEGAVYVGRPTRWGNPFPWQGSWITWAAVGLGYRGDPTGRRAAAVALFSAWITGEPVVPPDDSEDGGGWIEFSDGTRRSVADHARGIALGATSLYESPVLPETTIDVTDLYGRDLACWCPLNEPCHADVLLALANDPACASGQDSG